MLLELSDAELATAATACRAMAYQEGERAKKMVVAYLLFSQVRRSRAGSFAGRAAP